MSLVLVTVAVIASFVVFMSVISLIALATTSWWSRRRSASMADSVVDAREPSERLTATKHTSSVA
ncbi:MAG: hypothetical protein AAFO29_01730 [Actinomycetota bacterium]